MNQSNNKPNKYDRQVRLWGENGQKKLSSSHVVLFNSESAVGTETLKNLILPGIGSFHIIDETNDCSQLQNENTDINSTSSNFFLPIESDDDLIDKSIAAKTCKYLCELNNDVKGSYESRSCLFKELPYEKVIHDQYLKSCMNDSSNKSSDNDATMLVIAADLDIASLLTLSKVCDSKNIPLLIIKSYGLIGCIRLQCRKHVIIESKPDNSIPDLRLANSNLPTSFPELFQIVTQTNFQDLENIDHGRIPYIIILLKALETFRSNFQKQLPTCFAEKNQFKDIIKNMSRDYHKELNFQEAHDNAYLAYTKRSLPNEVISLLEKASSNNPTTSFDTMIKALHIFLSQHDNEPPLIGSIPDMTSGTKQFILLQQAYQTKATRDFQKLQSILNSIHSENPQLPCVSNEELALFCKNIYNIRVLSTSSFEEEIYHQASHVLFPPSYSLSTSYNFEEIRMNLISTCEDVTDMLPPDDTSSAFQTPLLWYLALRACEIFQYQHSVWPGKDTRQLALSSDVDALSHILKSLLQQMKLDQVPLIKKTLLDSLDLCKEMTRYYNAEVHSIASFIGGVASQEAVKIITQQYVPMSNVFVYNGISSTCDVYHI